MVNMKFRYQGRWFHFHPHEFPRFVSQTYNNLWFYDGIGRLENRAGFLNEIGTMLLHFQPPQPPSLVQVGLSHGGLVPILCATTFQKIHIFRVPQSQRANLVQNSQHVSNVTIEPEENKIPSNPVCIHLEPGFFHMPTSGLTTSFICCDHPLVNPMPHHIRYTVNHSFYLYVPNEKLDLFQSHFRWWIHKEKKNEIQYENLLHYTMIVKNGGPLLRQVLTENLPFIDRWTILDTGSTDGTQDVIRDVLAEKPGTLYEEPFINFRDSRNRCLDLAGTSCTFIVMLDDTYLIQGDLRSFLQKIRNDVFATSYSFIIKSGDLEYSSNRIFKSAHHLRYVFSIHEVLQQEGNKNVMVPFDISHIVDLRDPYMEQRTISRKQMDLRLLYEMIEEEPDNPRHLYYLAQTYRLLGNVKKTEEFYIKRIRHPNQGFIQEKFDTVFELARLYHFELHRPWNEVETLYLQSFELDKSRPEPMYFIGIHYHLNGDRTRAFLYFKKAFDLGYSQKAQYSLKPGISYHYLPKFLAPLCYDKQEWKTGHQCTSLFLSKNKFDAEGYTTMQSWERLFYHLDCLRSVSGTREVDALDPNNFETNNKPILCFFLGTADPNTRVVQEMIPHFHNLNIFTLLVFSEKEDVQCVEGVRYLPFSSCYAFFRRNIQVHSCFIMDNTEWVPLCIHAPVQRIFLFVQEWNTTGNIIPMDPKLRGIFCQSMVHRNHLLQIYPTLEPFIKWFYPGFTPWTPTHDCRKVPLRFVWTSFPQDEENGAVLLQFWAKIRQQYPQAELYLCSENTFGLEGIVCTGCSYELWDTADVWLDLSSCTSEPFCPEVYTAAFTRTLILTSGPGCHGEMVGDRGLVVEGDPRTEEWQERALNALHSVLKDRETNYRLREQNYEWVLSLTWEKRISCFYQTYMQYSEI